MRIIRQFLFLLLLLSPGLVQAQVAPAAATAGTATDLDCTECTSLTSEVNGVLPVANGGTGLSLPGDAGNVLMSDGTAWVSGASPGLQYFTEGQSTASPNNVSYVDYFEAAGDTARVDIAIVPKGGGALTRQVPNGSSTAGNKRGANATDWSVSNNATRVASGSNSTIGGGTANTASGAYSTIAGGVSCSATAHSSTVGGGQANVSSNTYSTVGGGYTNTASGEFSTVGGGDSNTVSTPRSFIGGGQSNDITASGIANNNVIVGGYNNTISGSGTQTAFIGGGTGNSITSSGGGIVGGSGNTASNVSYIVGGNSNTGSGGNSFIGAGLNNVNAGNWAVIPGGRYGTTRATEGSFAMASGRFATTGDAQWRELPLRRQTTDATPASLSSSGDAPSSTSVNVLAANHAVLVQVLVVGRKTDSTDFAAWECVALAYRDGSSNTAFVGSPTCTPVGTAHGTWSATLVVDDVTRESVEVQVTGAAATNINWFAIMRSAEVG